MAPSYQYPEWRDLALAGAAAHSGSYCAITATMPLRCQLTLLHALADPPCKSDQRTEAGALFTLTLTTLDVGAKLGRMSSSNRRLGL